MMELRCDGWSGYVALYCIFARLKYLIKKTQSGLKRMYVNFPPLLTGKDYVHDKVGPQ